MKVRVWVVSTTIPERGEGPCMPAVFGSDVEAEAYADTMLRDEWNAAAIADGEADEAMPYPGAWREAQDRLIKLYGDGSWGTWQITAHDVEIIDLPCHQ
jgi:tartrate dehydratase alpha subunit/fumarate hydratase class I-like protein